MRVIDITKRNIRACGYEVGKGIKKKGTEILTPPYYISGAWGLQDMDKEDREREVSRMIGAIEREGADNVFVKEIKLIEHGVKEYDYSKMHEKSLKRFNIRKIIDSNFKDIIDIVMYSIPQVVCVLPLSKFKSDLESQQELVRMLTWEAEKKEILYDFFDSPYDEIDGLITFSNNRGNSLDPFQHCEDRTLFHGPSTCLNDGELESVDDRFFGVEDSIIENCGEPGALCVDPLIWIDPEERVSVYVRKNRYWYVTSGVEHKLVYLTYRDYEGKFVKDTKFCYFVALADDDLIKKVKDGVKCMLSTLQMKNSK